uniref:Uncharacterized protein n=1 Tax=Arundo donax TaxID=35708 RepID=A0A0A9DSA5_ARUDO
MKIWFQRVPWPARVGDSPAFRLGQRQGDISLPLFEFFFWSLFYGNPC